MLVTCPDCGGEISYTAVICPHCGFRGEYWDGNQPGYSAEGAAYFSPERTEERKEFHRQWEKEKKERELENQRIAAEEKRRARERQIQEEWENRKRNDPIMFFIIVMVLAGIFLGLVFGIRGCFIHVRDSISGHVLTSEIASENSESEIVVMEEEDEED